MKFVTGLLIGIIVGAGTVLYWTKFRQPGEPPIFTVSHIKSHYPQPGDNSETTLMVYRTGASGHVKEILCRFPPAVVLEGGPNPSLADKLLGEPEPRWTGLKKIRVLEKAGTSGFSTTAYYCEKIG